jgi:hypothetical protein
VLTIGFDGINEGDTLTFPGSQSIWPVHSSGNQDFQGFPENFDDVYYSSPDMFSPTASDQSVSNFYYQQSRTVDGEPFKVTYEFFPHRINVPILPDDQGNIYFTKFISRAYDTIQSRFNDASWYEYFAQFDQRTNSNFQFDNSVNPTPDGKIDYLLILFRFNSPPSDNQSLEWMGSIGHDAWAGVPGRTITFANGNSIGFNKGFTVQKGIKSYNTFASLFIHEDGHTFYNGPHVFGANSVVGEYFYTGNGWGGIATQPRIYYSYNAWDRWWLNWIEIKYDLSSNEHNGAYILEDFITTGDAMRLKLPTPDGQYVWFENRTGHTVFDERLGYTKDGAQNSIPSASHGVVGFVEAISDNQTSVSVFSKGANSLRAINPNGNFDYEWSSYRDGNAAPEWWGNRIYNFTTVQDNPFSPHNSLTAIRDDFFGDSIHFSPNGEISFDTNTNSPNKQKREQFSVIEQNGEVVYGPTGHNIAFSPGTKLSISTNPGLIALQKYSREDKKLDPIYLHGLSVEVLYYVGSGVNRKAVINVKYDDYEVDRDVRWTGDIILPADVPLVLNEGKILTVDKSGTPNRHTLTPAGDFINPTKLTFEEGAGFTLGANSTMYVKMGSTLHLKPQSKLTITEGAKLYIQANSIYSIDDCAELEILPGGKVIVEEGAIIKISHNAILSAHDGQEAFSVHPSAIVPQGYVHPHEVVPPAYRIATGNHVWDAPSYVMHYDLVVEPGAKLTLQNPSLAFAGQKGITVGEGAELSIEGGLLIPNAGCSDNNVWRGIRVEGNPNEPQTAMQQGQLSMIGTTIERAKWGVQTSSGIVSVSGATFLNNEVGISFSGYRYGTSANLSEITNSTFTINDEMPQGVTPAFITLKHVAKIKIAGNTFQNVLPLAFPIPNKGYGIRAFDADVYLGQGANTFNDLFTAIDASAAITSPSLYIKNQVFERCYNGVRVSAYVSPLIRGCSFTVPNHQFESSVPTAIAIRNLNSFIVESNTIQGSGIGYGIYLEHTKSSSGVVNANSIQGLSVGVMAQGNIKRTDNTVQLKCNQFNNNGLSDILVSGNGIASIQGSRDISASNRFMESYRHIVAEHYPITYYGFAHVAEYDPSRIEGAVTVLRAERLADCSSHTGPKTYEMDGIQQASDSLVATRILLSEMQDMGETEILLTEVEEFSGYNPLDLRDALLAKSPLLSDTVMVRTSAEEVPLPNIMLAQVLMDNPQAAKSMAVLQSLSSRENPLPSYLLNAILESGGNSSPIDELKSLAAKHRAERDITASMLAYRFVSDTLCKQYDSLQMLSAYHPDLIYRYISAFAAYEAGDKSQAISMLNSIGADGSLGATEMNELNDLVNLASIIAQQGEIPDSSALAEIYALSNNSEGLAKTLVQNVISFIDTVPFLAPEYVLDRATSSPESQGYNAFVEVKPYPVTSYAILHYNMGKTVSTKGTIEISNEDGVVVYQTSLTRSQFELLVKIDGWRPGLYKVFLYDSDVLLAQTSFIVEGNEHIDEDLSPIANEDSIDVVIYPNPTSGKFSIGVKGKSQMPFTYEVFTDMGVKVLSGKGVGEENLSITNNDKGVYLVVVTVNEEKFNLSVLLK